MNSYQGTNSFFTPTSSPVSAPVTSGIQTYSDSSLGGINPLISDLLTANPLANKFQQQTYTADPTKVNERLGQYQAYNANDLGDLASYFAPNAALSTGGKLYFKPEDFNKASSGITTLEGMGLTNTPLSEDTTSIGKYKDQDYFTRQSLMDELDVRDKSIFDNMYAQYGLSGYTPTTYNLPTPTTVVDPEGNLVSGPMSAPFDPDAFIGSVLGGQKYDFSSIAPYLPRSNEIIPHNPAFGQLLSQFDSLYTSKPTEQLVTGAGKALGLTDEEVKKIAGITAGNMYKSGLSSGYEPFQMGYGNYTQPYMNTLTDFYKQAYGKEIPTEMANYLSKGGTDIAGQFGQARDIQSQSGGVFTDALPMISMILKFTPLAPVAYAYDAYNAIKSGSPLAMAASALGAYGGLTGTDIAGSIGGGINSAFDLGLSPEMMRALGSATLGTGMGMLGGQDFGSSLAGGLGSAAGGYFGSDLAKSLDLSPAMARAVSGIGSGLGGAVVSGGDLGMAAMGGGLGALSSFGGNTINPINTTATIAQQILKDKRRKAALNRG